MFNKYINPKQELYIMFKKENLIAIYNRGENSDDNCIFVHYKDSNSNVFHIGCNLESLIKETKGSEYMNRKYSVIKPTEEEEIKFMTLLNIGLSVEELICSMFLENKINNFEWRDY